MKAGSRKEYYQRMKRRTRTTAAWYQSNFDEIMKTSGKSFFEWTEYFRIRGKRYGLLREFIENGII